MAIEALSNISSLMGLKPSKEDTQTIVEQQFKAAKQVAIGEKTAQMAADELGISAGSIQHFADMIKDNGGIETVTDDNGTPDDASDDVQRQELKSDASDVMQMVFGNVNAAETSRQYYGRKFMDDLMAKFKEAMDGH